MVLVNPSHCVWTIRGGWYLVLAKVVVRLLRVQLTHHY